MAFAKLVKRYKTYEADTLRSRSEKREKLSGYRTLKNKRKPAPKRKFNATAYTKSIGNPYEVKLPEPKKVVKKRKSPKKRKAVKKKRATKRQVKRK